jgi:hypothetical protein
MVTIVKSEWHQVERQLKFDFDESILSEIYPDLEEEDIENLLIRIQKGEIEIEELINDAMNNNIDIDWDFSYDDWWTDRKGGYEVTYSVSDEPSDVVFTPTTAWPFPSGNIVPESDSVEDEEILKMLSELTETYEKLENSEVKEFTIKLYGRGTDRGIGTITKEQYEYWNEHSDDLGDALNDQYDYEENETPEEARLPYEYYNEYEDIAFETGIDEDSCYIEITDPDGNEVYDDELFSFLTTVHGDSDSCDEATEETDEMYLNTACMPAGYYVYWQQGGKGTYFEGTIFLDKDSEFDPKLLKFNTVDFDGNSMITTVLYDNEEINNDGGEWSGKWDDYQVIEVKE